MEFFSKKLVRSKEIENKIKFACSFNNEKCEFEQGRILTPDKTNIIEPQSCCKCKR